MGLAKREMERGQEMQALAEDIAVQAGCLKRCPHHEEILMENDPGNDRIAYALGTNLFKSGAVDGDRTEFMDAIKEAVESGADGCPICQKATRRDD